MADSRSSRKRDIATYMTHFDFTQKQSENFYKHLRNEPRIFDLLKTARTTKDFKRDFEIFMSTPYPQGAKRDADKVWRSDILDYQKSRAAREAAKNMRSAPYDRSAALRVPPVDPPYPPEDIASYWKRIRGQISRAHQFA